MKWNRNETETQMVWERWFWNDHDSSHTICRCFKCYISLYITLWNEIIYVFTCLLSLSSIWTRVALKQELHFYHHFRPMCGIWQTLYKLLFNSWISLWSILLIEWPNLSVTTWHDLWNTDTTVNRDSHWARPWEGQKDAEGCVSDFKKLIDSLRWNDQLVVLIFF